jgi:hypothetical protein
LVYLQLHAHVKYYFTQLRWTCLLYLETASHLVLSTQHKWRGCLEILGILGMLPSTSSTPFNSHPDHPVDCGKCSLPKGRICMGQLVDLQGQAGSESSWNYELKRSQSVKRGPRKNPKSSLVYVSKSAENLTRFGLMHMLLNTVEYWRYQ